LEPLEPRRIAIHADRGLVQSRVAQDLENFPPQPIARRAAGLPCTSPNRGNAVLARRVAQRPCQPGLTDPWLT
jgi:hypothetical protein